MHKKKKKYVRLMIFMHCQMVKGQSLLMEEYSFGEDIAVGINDAFFIKVH